ncbi:MAG: hypothetical protein RL531_599 [Actinomycetota bacterium]
MTVDERADPPQSGLAVLRGAPLRHRVRDGRGPLALGAALLVVPAVVLVLAGTAVTGPETRAFRLLNDLPAALGTVLEPAMALGTIPAVVVIAILVGWVYRRPAPVIALAAGSWTAYVTAQILKEIVGRARPVGVYVELNLRAAADGFGFVSGHAAVAAGAAAALAPWLDRRARVIAWCLVVIVATARVYVGVHLPLDVVGGVGVGLICGTLATIAAGTPDR